MPQQDVVGGTKCIICGEDAPLRCASCKRVAYCGKPCQVAHWKYSHKNECKSFKAAREKVSGGFDARAAKDVTRQLEDQIQRLSIKEALAELNKAQAEVERLRQGKKHLEEVVNKARSESEEAQGAAERARAIAMLAGLDKDTAFAAKSTHSSAPEYADRTYWEETYRARRGEAYEWYIDYSQLRDVIEETLGAARAAPLLEVGCGNSSLGLAMAGDGYQQLTSIDISPSVIVDMQARALALGLEGLVKYVEADASDLSRWEDGYYAGALDKGTLDAVASQDPNKALRICEEVFRVLRPGAPMLVVSSMTRSVFTQLLAGGSRLDIEEKKIATEYGESVRAFVLRRRESVGNEDVAEERKRALAENADRAWDAIQGLLSSAKEAMGSEEMRELLVKEMAEKAVQKAEPDGREGSSLCLGEQDGEGLSVRYVLKGRPRHGDFIALYDPDEGDLLTGYRDFAFVDEDGEEEGEVVLGATKDGNDAAGPGVVRLVNKSGWVLAEAPWSPPDPHSPSCEDTAIALPGAGDSRQRKQATAAVELQPMIGSWRVLAQGPGCKHVAGVSWHRRGDDSVLILFEDEDDESQAYQALVRLDIGPVDWDAIQLEPAVDHVSLRLPLASGAIQPDLLSSMVDRHPATLAQQLDTQSKSGPGLQLACRFCEASILRPVKLKQRSFLPLPSERLDDVSDFLLCFADAVLPLTSEEVHARPGLVLVGEDFLLIHEDDVDSVEGSHTSGVVGCPRCGTELGVRLKSEEGERHGNMRLWIHRLAAGDGSDKSGQMLQIFDQYSVETHIAVVSRAAVRRLKKRRFVLKTSGGLSEQRLELELWGSEVLFSSPTSSPGSSTPSPAIKVLFRIDEQAGTGASTSYPSTPHVPHGSHGACGHARPGDALELLLPLDEWLAAGILLKSCAASLPASCHTPFTPRQLAYLHLMPSRALAAEEE